VKVEKGKLLNPIIIIHYENKNIKGRIIINSKNPQDEKRFKKSLVNDILSQYDNLKIFHEKSFTKNFNFEWLRIENEKVVSFKRKNSRKNKKITIDPD